MPRSSKTLTRRLVVGRMLLFDDAASFAYKVVCATLAARPVQFRHIRVDAAAPGLLEEEVELLRLVQSVSNGCVVELSKTGCFYKPGVLVGGAVAFASATSRSLSYLLEPLAVLGLFGKKELRLTLEGVTHAVGDPSAELLRHVTLPTIARFCDIETGLDLKVLRRGAAPDGGGKVLLTVPIIRQIPSVRWTDEGMVKRIRGVAFSLKISPQFSNKMVEAARGVLNPYLADVHVFTDAVRGKDSGNSPGYGLYLVAETTTGCLMAAEALAQKSDASSLPSAESVGQFAAAALREEIRRGGVVDAWHQPLLLLLCALGPELMSEVRFGPLSPRTVDALRILRDVFGVVFGVRVEKEHGTIFLSCLGKGVKNIARQTA